MNRFIAIALLLLILISCSDITFDSKRWKNDDPDSYPVRRYMVKDLIKSGRLLNLTDSAIFDFLGTPSSIDSTTSGKIDFVRYTVRVSFGFDIDPVYVETLQIKLDTTSKKSISVKLIKSDDSRGFIEKLVTE